MSGSRADEYFDALGVGLDTEVRESSVLNGGGPGELEARLADLRAARGVRDLSAAYARAARAVADELTARTSIADTAESMKQFWSMAEDVGAGRSAGTYWDTYEHGSRRRLEQVFARGFGAEDALLVNSGMSAIVCAVDAALISGSRTIVRGSESYFESTDFLDNVVALRPGVSVVVRDTADLGRGRPTGALLLTETVFNSPAASPGLGGLREASLAGPVLVDNTLPSWATSFAEISAAVGPEALVLESATKYLTRECSAGVVYGARALVEPVRDVARMTGQQLQSRAFWRIRPAEVEHASLRLSIHGENAHTFAEQLDPRTVIVQDQLRRSHQGDPTSSTGSLIFVQVPGLTDYRRLLERWQDRVSVPVRAGFGWDLTTARSYDGTKLNRHDSPEYLRVSVGLEDRTTIQRYGTALMDAVKECRFSRAGAPSRSEP